MSITPVIIRASSLGALFDCPARWAAIHLEGKRMPSTGKAQLGKAIHASTAVFDQAGIDGSGITIDEAAAAAVDVIHCREVEEEVIWEDDSPQAAEKIALALHAKYCHEIAPKQQYCAVEVQCEQLDITDIGISLTGTTDRIRKVGDGFSIVDIKSGKTAVSADGTVKTAGHAYQMGVYEILAEKASGVSITAPAQIVGLNTGKTAAAQRAGTGEISGAREVLLGDEESPGVLQMASKLIHGGDFFGNPRSMMCSQNYCPNFSTCKFRR